MADSDKTTRRSSEAERARHAAADEAGAFVIMLLGALNGAEAAHRQLGEHEPQPPEAHPPAPPPVHPTDAAPQGLIPADHGPSHEDQHAGAIEPPSVDPAPMLHAEAGATVQAPEAGATIAPTPAAETVVTHGSAPPVPVESFSAPADHAPPLAGSGSIAGTTAPSSLDLGASVQQVANTITGLIDTSLATVSHAVADLTATAGQLVTSLTDTVSHLTDGLSGTVTNLIHDTPVVGTVDTLVTDILSPAHPAADTDSFATSPHGASLLDTAGAVPTALLHPLPLQLGFLGQPTIDGHDTHDGAFSALGVHHF